MRAHTKFTKATLTTPINNHPLNLGEDGDVEVVVVISHHQLPYGVDAHSNGVVSETDAPNCPQEGSMVIEHHHAMAPVVTDEDLLPLVHRHPVREVELFVHHEAVEYRPG